MPLGETDASAAAVGISVVRPTVATAESRERIRVLSLCLLSDATIFLLAFSFTTLTRFHTLIYLDSLWLLHRDQIMVAGAYLLAIMIAGGYSPPRMLDRFDAAYYAVAGVITAGVGALAIWTVLPSEWMAMSRRELLGGSLVSMGLLTLWRFYLGGLLGEFASMHRYFTIVGDGDCTARIVEEIRKSTGRDADATALSVDELQRELACDPGRQDALYPNRDAIIMLTQPDRAELIQALELCETHFSRTFIYPSLHDTLFFPHSKLLAVGGIPLIEISNRHLFTPYLFFKRVVDIAVASLGLLLAAPIALITAIAVASTSPGPVFYTQERMGLHGRRFKLYKFRSMVTDAEAMTGPIWASTNDIRVTPVGKFIRKHRIDELPQLLNVLKGDMSLIGPRPERPEIHCAFCEQWPLFDRRLAVRPGVTSLSHVLGSYESDPEDRLRYDLIYINNLSLFMDVRILVATVRVVLGAKGAQ